MGLLEGFNSITSIDYMSMRPECQIGRSRERLADQFVRKYRSKVYGTGSQKKSIVYVRFNYTTASTGAL
jgi:hypothetical protein